MVGWFGLLRLVGLGLVGGVLLVGCGGGGEGVVVVYSSQDQVYGSEVLGEFEGVSSLEVRALFDSESVKTMGLVNRLVAERGGPRCDVFWSNEELMVRRLAGLGVVEWEGVRLFGYRGRRLVVNTDLVGEGDLPSGLEELTGERWRGRVAVAYPLFGTTLTHFLALRELWGVERWEGWCLGLLDNDVWVVDGNSAVVRLVGSGVAWVGLTDSDDVGVGVGGGLPVRGVVWDGEFPLVRNCAVLVSGAGNVEGGRLLLDFLGSEGTVERLVGLGALEGGGVEGLEGFLEVDWVGVLDGFEEGVEWLGGVFLR